MRIESSKREIINSQDIQNAYLKFYPFMMNYLWDLHTVMDLANLEIAIYKVFPDREEMLKCLDLLEVDIRDTYKQEEELDDAKFKEAFKRLKDCIEDYEDCGYEIMQIRESVDLDDIKNSNPDISKKSSNKKTLNVGKVVKR